MSSAVLKQVIPLGLKCYQRTQTASLWIWKALGQPAASFKEIFHTGASSIPINLPTHLWNVHVRHPWGSFFHIPKLSSCFPDSPRLRVFLALVDVFQGHHRLYLTVTFTLSAPPPILNPTAPCCMPAPCCLTSTFPGSTSELNESAPYPACTTRLSHIQRTRRSPRALCPRLDFVSRSGRIF